MYLRALLSAILCCLALGAGAQHELIGDAVVEYFQESNHLQVYGDISVQWKTDGQTQVHLNEGINNLFDGKPALAETNFSDVLKRDSTVWQALYYRAVCRKQLDRLGDARADLLHLLATRTPFYEGYVELGKVEYLRRDFKSAERYYEKAIKLEPGNALAYYLNANLQLDQAQRKPALKSYASCLARDSLFHDARMHHALVDAVVHNNLEVALEPISHVLRSDSLNRNALLLRSLLAFTSNQAQTLVDLDNLMRVNPGNLMGLYLRGVLLTKMKDYARAYPDFHKIIEVTYQSENTFSGKQTLLDKKIDIQNVGAYTASRVYGLSEADAPKIKKAYCLLILGSYDECIATIHTATVAKTEPLCFYLKGVASEHKGSHPDALAYYNQALALDNDILDAHKKRAIYAQELKQWDRSIADLNEVLRINPEAYIAYKIRGISYYHANRFSNAIADFTRYLQRDSTDQEVIAARGMAYQRAGRYLDGAVDLAHSNNASVLNFGKLSRSLDSLLTTGDTLKTLAYTDKLLKDMPFFTQGFVLKFKVLLSNDQWDSVASQIDEAVRFLDYSSPSTSDQSFLLTLQGKKENQKKNYDKALVVLTNAIKLNSQNAQAFLERGKAHLALEKTGKALSDLKKASSLGSLEASEVLRAFK